LAKPPPSLDCRRVFLADVKTHIRIAKAKINVVVENERRLGLRRLASDFEYLDEQGFAFLA
tara:strand:- start:3216 stop:3398 length:183 start_codon:yes stop_codon:yes gene_type:complete